MCKRMSSQVRELQLVRTEEQEAPAGPARGTAEAAGPGGARILDPKFL